MNAVYGKMFRTLACCALMGGATLGCVAAGAQVVGESRRKVPQDPDVAVLNKLLADAQAALDAKDYATAAKDFQDFLAKKPDYAPVHFQLGYTYTAMGRTADAVAEYQKAVDIDPSMAEAQLNLGLTLLQTDPAKAIGPLSQAVALKPNQIEANLALAAAYERTNKPADAERFDAVAVKIDPKNFEAHAGLARVLLQQKKADQAETEFRAALAIQPDYAPGHLGLSQSLTLQGKSDAAAEELKKYSALRPNDPVSQLDQASLLAKAGKDDEALAALDAAVAASKAPETESAMRLRVAILFHKKDYAGMVPVLQKLIAIAPANPDYPAELGHALLEKKDYAEAAKELIVALKANPSSEDVLKDLILAEYLGKNYSATLQLLEVMEKHTPLPMGSWFVRASCWDSLNHKPEALAAYQKFLSMNTDENSDMYFEASARARTLTREIAEKKR
jgi:tetratricopeptide (TPR) repeat protein